MLRAIPLADHPRNRVRTAGEPDLDGRAVVYWMQRAQRAGDNPALDAAISIGNALRKPVVAVFILNPRFPGANARHFQFMFDGLAELPVGLRARRVGFVLRVGGRDEVARFCEEVRAAVLVGDENPLRDAERWRHAVALRVRAPFVTVDADVVVPTVLLEKEQWSAGTIRPRIHRHLEFCLRPPVNRRARVEWKGLRGIASLTPSQSLLDGFPLDRSVAPATGVRGGRRAGLARLRGFVHHQLNGYARDRNRPEREGTSRLSPFLHFGQLGPREVALAVRDADAPPGDRQAFLEELIVRRELATNFVRFNPSYDRVAAGARWAVDTLARHRADRRDRVYSERELGGAQTHDPLWNAAQRQMAESGWMHGYLRMYWAKKILEWTRSPDEALAIANALNDRYELDGRDPNGYAGVAWAIVGKHDRAWGPERPVLGTIRYMSFASTSRKFDSKAYIARWGAGR
jgi:deoxyribodipyrimidine photo-lyase